MTESHPKYLLLGSCFAQNMGKRLLLDGSDAVVNPLGTLYNPESIRLTVSTPRLEVGSDLVFYDSAMGEWRSWLANTKVRNTDPDALIHEINSQLDALHNRMAQACECVITLGTNVCYRLVANSLVVTNCQRQPDRLFKECRLSLEECVDSLEKTLSVLWQHNPTMHITITVSPYRYKKYGLHGSQLSKATLLLAVDDVVRRHDDRVSYFPSYEIMMDELRDYSYYAQDGLHPSDEAVEIIWNRYKAFLNTQLPCLSTK